MCNEVYSRRFMRLGSAGAAAFLTVICASAQAWSQEASTPIPLDVFGTRLGITIGVNNGTAEEYLFDTGSDQFNIAIGGGASVPWFPDYAGSKDPSKLTPYLYGDGTYGYLFSKETISSIQFYPPSSGGGVSYTAALPVGAVVYDIQTAASLSGNGLEQGSKVSNADLPSDKTYYVNQTWQNAIAAGTAPEEGKLYGTFGAGDYGNSILGRLTTTGYVVEANGTTTTPGGCGQACLIMNLTPELRAQFFNVVPWTADAKQNGGTFPISGANASTQYGAALTYVLGSGTNVSSRQLATMLDTGYSGNEIDSATVFNQQKSFGNLTSVAGTGGVYVNQGLTFNISGGAGAQTLPATTSQVTTNESGSAVSSDFLNSVVVQASNDDTAIAGLSFFKKAAVLYDLQNQSIGYTPFYVTVSGFNGLTVSQAMGPLGVAGVISGSNGVTVQDDAYAYLTAANTYTGATGVTQKGWLGVGGPGSIAFSSNVQINGTLDLIHSNGNQDIRSLSGGGAVVLGDNTLVLTDASGQFSGAISNFYPDGTETDQPYPVITGTPTYRSGGVIVAGGTETFSGDNYYTGDTGVGESGALILTGTLENSDVLNAGYFQNDGLTRQMTLSTGTVAGNGNFAGGLNVASGFLAPGDLGQTAPGHMTVGNSLTMGSGATYVAKAIGADASRIDVRGQATINGSTFDALVGSSPQLAALGQRYTVLTASEGVGGAFGAVTGNLGSAASQYPFLDADLGYTPDAVSFDLVRSPIPFAATAQTPNEFGVAMGLDTMNASLPASRAAASLSLASAPGAFNTLAGDLHSSLRTNLIENAYDLSAAALARLDSAACLGNAPAQIVSYGQGQPAANDGECHSGRLAAWIQAYDSWSRNGGADGVSGLLGSSGGFIGGIDAPAPGDWRVGGLIGYVHSSFAADSTAASGSADNVSFGAYAGRFWGAIGLKLGAAYTWNMVSTTRTVALPGFWDQTAANYGGGTGQAFADLSYRFALQGVSAEPFANLAYVNQDMSSFHESGFSGAALHGASEDMGVTFVTLGARATKGFTLAQFALEADAAVGYRHALGSVTPMTGESFLFGGVGFDVSGVPVPRDVALLNLGVKARLSDSVKVGVAYVGEYGGSYSQNGIKGNVDWSF